MTGVDEGTGADDTGADETGADETGADETGADETGADPREVGEHRRLAAALAGMLEQGHRVLQQGQGDSATARRLAEHLGGVRIGDAVVVNENFPSFQHVTVHRGVLAYLDERGESADWLGARTPHRMHMEFTDILLEESRSGRETIPPAEFAAAASGPDTTEQVVSFGLVCTHDPDGAPVVIGLGMTDRFGPGSVALHVFAAESSSASAVLDRVRALSEERDVLRGQVVTFGYNEHYGNQLVSFMPRPDLTAEDVILPDGLLERITDYVIGTGQHAVPLRRMGIHLKRGLLLFGPPGTGKTHVVRYLSGLARESTVVILSGRSMEMIEQAAGIARKFTPAVVVLEDVDLVAQHRSHSRTGNPFLFTLLDAMDGVSGDADITFLLTTNRPQDLEEALVQRPGRIDVAIEVPRPDAAGRERLLRLYAGSATIAADLAPAIEATEGATASAIKELMRRAVISALTSGAADLRGEVTDSASAGQVSGDAAADREVTDTAAAGQVSDAAAVREVSAAPAAREVSAAPAAREVSDAATGGGGVAPDAATAEVIVDEAALDAAIRQFVANRDGLARAFRGGDAVDDLDPEAMPPIAEPGVYYEGSYEPY